MDNHIRSDNNSAQSQLFNKIKQEFGKHGDYVCAMLETAECLLKQRKPAPMQGLAAIYCVRQAMVEIFKNTSNTSSRWKDISRQVVCAKHNIVVPKNPDEEELLMLYKTIDRLNEVHSNNTIHQKRLEAFVRKRTGRDPLDGDNSLLDEYQHMIDELNNLIHDIPAEVLDSMGDADSQYRRAIDMLSRMLLPTERLEEIIRLAKLPDPQDSDARRLKECLMSLNDFTWFAENIRSPAWFKVMGPDLLNPPPDTWAWLIPHIANHLKHEHVDAFVCMIEEHWDEWTKNNAGVEGLTRATFRLGERGFPFLVRLLRENPEAGSVHTLGFMACQCMDPTNPLIVDLADLLLNHFMFATPGNNYILAKLVEGMDLTSSEKRIKILIRKRTREKSDHHHAFNGGIANVNRKLSYEDTLTAFLCDALTKGRDLGNPTQTLVKWLAPLPAYMKTRFEAWLYLGANDIDCSCLTDFVVNGCRNRIPTSDDVALLDRLMHDCDMKTVTQALADVIGTAPKSDDLEDIMRLENRLEDKWRVEWAVEIGNHIELSGWENILNILGKQDRNHASMEYGGFIRPTSVFTQEEFDSEDPYDLAAKISSWRPVSKDILNPPSAYGIRNHLEDAVKRNPDRWVTDPLRMIKTLKHPTYVAGYFQGLISAGNALNMHADSLIQAVRLASTHPWQIVPLDFSLFEYDNIWQNTDIAGIDLIRSLFENDLDMSDEGLSTAWEIVGLAVSGSKHGIVENMPAGAAQTTYPKDPLSDAINEPHTRAMSTMLYMIQYTKNKKRDLPEKILEMLTDVLRLGGRDGAMYRAIIASNARRLHSCLPDWFEQNERLLFGDGAPENLAQLTLDMHLMWEFPDKDVLKKYGNRVADAVRRNVENAMDCLMIGMLLQIDGYDPRSLAKILADMGPEHVSLAGERVAWMLQNEIDVDFTQQGVEFWTNVLELSCKPSAFTGYGRYAIVLALEQNQWENLTRSTLVKGRLAWADEVARRIDSTDTITKTGLEILTMMIQSDLDPLEESLAVEHILSVLSKSKGDERTQSSWEHLRDRMLDKGHKVLD